MRGLRRNETEKRIDQDSQNGRGAYLCPCKACFDLSVKSHGLERSFKQEIPQEVYEKLAKEMERIGQR